MALVAKKKGSWPVRATGLLLAVRALGPGGVVAYHLSRVDWRGIEPEEFPASPRGTLEAVVEATVGLSSL